MPKNAPTGGLLSYPGANQVTKASGPHNRADGPTAGSGPTRRSQKKPGAPRVNKAGNASTSDTSIRNHFLRLERLYPGADRVIKATETITAHGTQTTETTTEHGTRTTDKRQRHPGADRVTKATDIPTAHGNKSMEHHGTMRLRHPRVIGQIHGPHHRHYPRAHWVTKATLRNILGKRIHKSRTSRTSTSSPKKSGYHSTS